ncbi:MAG: DUF4861 family protein [Bacteroidota bacterium]
MRQLLFYFFSMLLLVLIGCQSQELKLTVTYGATIDSEQTPVAIKMEDMRKHGMREVDTWAPFIDGQLLPHQYDDTDGDGKADELFFLLDFKAQESQTVTFKPESATESFEVRTHLQLGEKTANGIISQKSAPRLNTYNNKETQAKYQFEGIGWENDKVAFRNYLDLRNGMDIFGKTTSDMVLDRVGREGDASYHELQEWGMDILKVGSSLGAGSLAFWYQDSLIRLTGEDSDCQILWEGPLRSRFQLNFQHVSLGDQSVNITHNVTIVAGSYSYEGELTISPATEASVVVGLVDLHNLPAQFMASSSNHCLYTYGLQSENKDSLGMAVLVPSQSFQSYIDTDSISQTIPNSYGILGPSQDVHYRFYAGWEASSKAFDNEQAFQDYLKKEAMLWNQPLTLVWGE